MKLKKIKKLSLVLVFILLVQVLVLNVNALANTLRKNDTIFVEDLIGEKDILVKGEGLLKRNTNKSTSQFMNISANLKISPRDGQLAMLVYVFIVVYVCILGYVVYKKDYMK